MQCLLYTKSLRWLSIYGECNILVTKAHVNYWKCIKDNRNHREIYIHIIMFFLSKNIFFCFASQQKTYFRDNLTLIFFANFFLRHKVNIFFCSFSPSNLPTENVGPQKTIAPPPFKWNRCSLSTCITTNIAHTFFCYTYFSFQYSNDALIYVSNLNKAFI